MLQRITLNKEFRWELSTKLLKQCREEDITKATECRPLPLCHKCNKELTQGRMLIYSTLRCNKQLDNKLFRMQELRLLDIVIPILKFLSHLLHLQEVMHLQSKLITKRELLQ